MMRSTLLIVGLLFTAAFVADAVVELDVLDPSLTVGKDKSVTVTCTVTGESFLFWKDVMRNKELVLGENDVGGRKYGVSKSGDRYLLEFKNVQDNYCGLFRCQGDTNAAEVQLNVAASVDNNVCKKVQGIVKGTTDIVECKLFGCPRPTINWYKKIVGEYKEISNSRISVSGDSLKIENVQLSDEGDYKIHYKAGRSQDDVEISVEVHVAPEINRTETTDVYSYLGNKMPVTMKCSATGNPLPVVEIKKDGKSIGYYGKVVQNPGFFSVEITTTKDDSDKFGEYECTAANEVATVKYGINLDYAKKPVIVSVSRTIVGNLNGDTEISCRVTGKPYPHFTWHRNGSELMDGDKYTIMNNPGGWGNLLIKNTNEDDIGEYVCFAENFMGNVTGKPYMTKVEELIKGARGDVSRVVQNMEFLVAMFSLCLALMLS